MKYDFDSFIDRRGTGAVKWLSMTDDLVDRGIIPFTVADMEFAVSPAIQKALIESVQRGILGYTIMDKAYLNAVQSWMKRRHNWDIEHDWVVYSHGIVAALNTAIQAYTELGDGVIIQSPVYSPFTYAIQNNKRTLIENPLINDNGSYSMDFDDLENKCKQAKLLFLCSPHNPACRVWTAEELKRVGEICNRHGVIVISDEIHFDIIMPGYNHTVYATLGEEFMNNCVVCTATSKSFNVAGVHASNIIIPNEKLRKPFEDVIQAQGLQHDVVFFAHPVTLAAYNESEPWLDELIDYVHATQNEIIDFCADQMPDVKITELQGTYLNWLDFSCFGIPDTELKPFLAKEAEFFVNVGSYFGKAGEGYIRIDLASPRKKVMEGLMRTVDALKKAGKL